MKDREQNPLYIERCRAIAAYQAKDMESLEKSIRSLQKLLEVSAEDSMNLEYQLAKMQFDAINASLYFSEAMYQEAKEYSDSAAKAGKAGLILICNGGFLENPDTEDAALSDAWDCIAVLCSLYQQYLELKDISGALRAVNDAMNRMEELEKHLVRSPGICERAARYLWQMSTVFNTCGDLEHAIQSLDKAIVLYDVLYNRYHANYAKAMYLQSKMFRLGFYLAKGQAAAEELEGLEKETEALLTQSRGDAFEWNSCLVADASLKMFRGLTALSANQYAEAFRAFRRAQEQAESAKGYCEQLAESKDSWMAIVGTELVQKIIAAEITCTQQAAVCEYFLGNQEEAKELLEKTLKLMQKYAEHLPEIETTRSKIQAYTMLAELNGNFGEYDTASFYFERVAAESKELAEKTGLSQDWSICIHSFLFAMEYQKNCKQKEKAKTYAQRGLAACENMKRTGIQNDALCLQSSFEKMLKKGFFSKLF